MRDRFDTGMGRMIYSQLLFGFWPVHIGYLALPEALLCGQDSRRLPIQLFSSTDLTCKLPRPCNTKSCVYGALLESQGAQSDMPGRVHLARVVTLLSKTSSGESGECARVRELPVPMQKGKRMWDLDQKWP